MFAWETQRLWGLSQTLKLDMSSFFYWQFPHFSGGKLVGGVVHLWEIKTSIPSNWQAIFYYLLFQQFDAYKFSY